jgi:Zn-dependent alcohol dehydrogenase
MTVKIIVENVLKGCVIMTVNEIIKAQEICFLRQSREECGYCKECPVFQLNKTEHCQKFLAENTIKKLNDLTTLLDDKVNHHYYDTLEFLQNENISLREKIDKAVELLNVE